MEEILHQAEQLEKEYDWLGAAESYEKALNLLSEDDFSRKGDINERWDMLFTVLRFRLKPVTSLETGCMNRLLPMKRRLSSMERPKEAVKTGEDVTM